MGHHTVDPEGCCKSQSDILDVAVYSTAASQCTVTGSCAFLAEYRLRRQEDSVKRRQGVWDILEDVRRERAQQALMQTPTTSDNFCDELACMQSSTDTMSFGSIEHKPVGKQQLLGCRSPPSRHLRSPTGSSSKCSQLPPQPERSLSISEDVFEFDRGRLHELPRNLGGLVEQRWAAALRYIPRSTLQPPKQHPWRIGRSGREALEHIGEETKPDVVRPNLRAGCARACNASAMGSTEQHSSQPPEKFIHNEILGVHAAASHQTPSTRTGSLSPLRNVECSGEGTPNQCPNSSPPPSGDGATLAAAAVVAAVALAMVTLLRIAAWAEAWQGSLYMPTPAELPRGTGGLRNTSAASDGQRLAALFGLLGAAGTAGPKGAGCVEGSAHWQSSGKLLAAGEKLRLQRAAHVGRKPEVAICRGDPGAGHAKVSSGQSCHRAGFWKDVASSASHPVPRQLRGQKATAGSNQRSGEPPVKKGLPESPGLTDIAHCLDAPASARCADTLHPTADGEQVPHGSVIMAKAFHLQVPTHVAGSFDLLVARQAHGLQGTGEACQYDGYFRPPTDPPASEAAPGVGQVCNIPLRGMRGVPELCHSSDDHFFTTGAYELQGMAEAGRSDVQGLVDVAENCQYFVCAGQGRTRRGAGGVPHGCACPPLMKEADGLPGIAGANTGCKVPPYASGDCVQCEARGVTKGRHAPVVAAEALTQYGTPELPRTFDAPPPSRDIRSPDGITSDVSSCTVAHSATEARRLQRRASFRRKSDVPAAVSSHFRRQGAAYADQSSTARRAVRDTQMQQARAGVGNRSGLLLAREVHMPYAMGKVGTCSDVRTSRTRIDEHAGQICDAPLVSSAFRSHVVAGCDQTYIAPSDASEACSLQGVSDVRHVSDAPRLVEDAHSLVLRTGGPPLARDSHRAVASPGSSPVGEPPTHRGTQALCPNGSTPPSAAEAPWLGEAADMNQGLQVPLLARTADGLQEMTDTWHGDSPHPKVTSGQHRQGSSLSYAARKAHQGMGPFCLSEFKPRRDADDFSRGRCAGDIEEMLANVHKEHVRESCSEGSKGDPSFTAALGLHGSTFSHEQADQDDARTFDNPPRAPAGSSPRLVVTPAARTETGGFNGSGIACLDGDAGAIATTSATSICSVKAVDCLAAVENTLSMPRHGIGAAGKSDCREQQLIPVCDLESPQRSVHGLRTILTDAPSGGGVSLCSTSSTFAQSPREGGTPIGAIRKVGSTFVACELPAPRVLDVAVRPWCKGSSKGMSLLALMQQPEEGGQSQAEKVVVVPAPSLEGAESGRAGVESGAPAATTTKPSEASRVPVTDVKTKSVETDPPSQLVEVKGKGQGKGKGTAPPPPPEPKAKAKAEGKAKAKAGAKLDGADNPDFPSKGNKEVAKLKPLGWHKLTHADEGTLWAHAPDCEAFEVSRSLLELIFAWGTTSKKPSRARMEQDEAKVCLTTAARAMGICIGLHHLRHLTAHGVRDAILGLKADVLTPEVTDLLLTCDAKSRQPTVLPTSEEITAARSYVASGQSFDMLDDASKFLVAVHDVPHLHNRLLLHQFRECFTGNMATLHAGLSTMQDALKEVRNSKGLASTLLLILKTGNLLNDGTSRGDARGFRMNTLVQLSQLKQVEAPSAEAELREAPAVPGASSLTLVDHLVGIITEQRPELLDLVRELPNVSKAARIDLDDHARCIQQLRADLHRISASTCLQRHTENGQEALYRELKVESDVFESMAPQFVTSTTDRLSDLDEALKRAYEAYWDVAVFFGERRDARPSERIPAHEWLGFIERFLQDFQKAVLAQRARAELEEKRVKRRQERRTILARRGSPAAGVQKAGPENNNVRSSPHSAQDLGPCEEGGTSLNMLQAPAFRAVRSRSSRAKACGGASGAGRSSPRSRSLPTDSELAAERADFAESPVPPPPRRRRARSCATPRRGETPLRTATDAGGRGEQPRLGPQGRTRSGAVGRSRHSSPGRWKVTHRPASALAF